VNALLGLELETFPEELLGLLDDPNPRLRATLVRLMSQTGYRIPGNHIYKLLNHKGIKVRLGTLDLVCQVRETACVPTVRFLCYRDPALPVRSKAIAALVDLTGIRALPDLQALAFDAHPAVRAAVASSIGKMGVPLPAQAISILEHLRNDDETREVAESVLRTLPEPGVAAEPLETPGLPLPLPDPWTVTRQDFLTACIEWHDTLGKAALDGQDADEALAVQSALSSLIVALGRG
jgi:hypothetical protein